MCVCSMWWINVFIKNSEDRMGRPSGFNIVFIATGENVFFLCDNTDNIVDLIYI